MRALYLYFTVIRKEIVVGRSMAVGVVIVIGFDGFVLFVNVD